MAFFCGQNRLGIFLEVGVDFDKLVNVWRKLSYEKFFAEVISTLCLSLSGLAQLFFEMGQKVWDI